MKRRLFAVAVALVLLPGAAAAQSILAGGIIQEIRVEGMQRIEPETVRSYMRVNPGDPFDPARLDRKPQIGRAHV